MENAKPVLKPVESGVGVKLDENGGPFEVPYSEMVVVLLYLARFGQIYP